MADEMRKLLIALAVLAVLIAGNYMYNEVVPSIICSKNEYTSFSGTTFYYNTSYYKGELTVKIKSDTIDNKHTRLMNIFSVGDVADTLSLEFDDNKGYPIKIVSFNLNELNIADETLAAVKTVSITPNEARKIRNAYLSSREFLIKE